VGGRLLPDGYQRTWQANAGEVQIDVDTTVRVRANVEYRKHIIHAPDRMNVIEGSAALGLSQADAYSKEDIPNGQILRCRSTGKVIASRWRAGHTKVEPQVWPGVHTFSSYAAINSLSGIVGGSPAVFESVHLTSPITMSTADIERYLVF
jgi:hypothetical protein